MVHLVTRMQFYAIEVSSPFSRILVSLADNWLNQIARNRLGLNDLIYERGQAEKAKANADKAKKGKRK